MSRRAMQVKALLAMGILVGFGSVSTLASWTDSATATANLGAATVSLATGRSAAEATTAEYLVPVSPTNWYPGTSQAAMVAVKNTSTISVPYKIEGEVVETAPGTLGNALKVVVKTGSTVSGAAPNATCSGGAAIFTKASGSPFPAGVSRTNLSQGAAEALCVEYSLPLNAANSLQGNTTSVKLKFTATVGN
ncbi:hypothetical protein ACFO7V_11965 [Glutamicibacter bergerei]|uniref:Ribosomally synthesized peptide with SipW-like signal peptide n=1 Tax=Glutamicibacter bergerei TaxID=256702 RepID=A0ABV9MLL7_9MICC